MITNGTVKYTLPAAYAENRPGSEVTLFFSVPEGSDLTYAESFLAYTAEQARTTAFKLQSGQQVVAPEQATPPAIAEPPQTAAARGRKARAAAVTPGPTLAEAAASLVEAAQSLPGPVPATATAPTPASAGTPLPAGGNVVPLPTAAGPSTPVAIAGVPAAMPIAPAVGPTSVGATALSTDAIAVISDETLGQKVTGKLAEMRDILGVAQDVAVAKIHAVIQEFTGQPQGRLVDIAAAQREAFIAKLTALS